MARHEEDREDLMAEATALVPRVELQIPGREDSVILGQRSAGRLSVYFGADPVYHYEPNGQLRRAYVDGLLYRTQGTTLAALRKARTETTSELQRHDLTPDELTAFLDRMRSDIGQLAASLSADTHRIVQRVPDQAEFPDRATVEQLEAVAAGRTALAPPINVAR